VRRRTVARLGALFVVPSVVMGAVLVGAPVASASGGPYSAWFMRSAPGDVLGQGQSYDLLPPTTTISATGSSSHISMKAATPTTTWTAGFYPPTGSTLQEGQTYEATAQFPTATSAGLGVVVDSSGCSRYSGHFTVVQATFSGGTLQGVAIKFTLTCDESPGALSGWVSWNSDALLGPSDIALTGPASAARGANVALTGTLTNAGLPVASAGLTVTRTDVAGTTGLPGVTTAADGTFAVQDVPPRGGPVTYAVSYAGDATHDPATSAFTVAVERDATSLTIAVNGKVFIYGGLATVTIHLGPTVKSRQIQLWEYVYGVPNPHLQLVYQGNVGSSGIYSFSSHVYRHVSFAVKFLGDDYNAPAVASSYFTSLARITQTLRGAYGTSGSYHLFHPSVNPVDVAAISPLRGAIGSMRFTLQVLTRGGWATATTSAAFAIASNSTCVATLVGSHGTGIPARIRAYTSSDTVNAASTSGWAYLEFH
jgi:hypothetical protein